ncbi:MAG TPA: hypothetical protein VET65_10585 [Candidatus Limnocylindrales bacterium]|nr:hypothetical protein [Candidatus Limnocylindrales bacterium]
MTATTREQLRRLKNTVMGVSHRLTVLSRSADVPAPSAGSLADIAQDLAVAAERIDRLLSALDRER